jgi:hypothetical protein
VYLKTAAVGAANSAAKAKGTYLRDKFYRVWSKNSCGAPVVFQQASKAFSMDNCSTVPSAPIIVRREQQEVAFTLVIPLCVVVLGELSYGAPQRGLAKEDQLGQTLSLHGAHPSFRESIQVRAARRKSKQLYSAGGQDVPK